MAGDQRQAVLTRMRDLAVKLVSSARRRVSSVPDAGNEGPTRQKLREKNRKLKRLRQQLEEKDRELEKLRARLDGRHFDVESGGVEPENIVWVFGAGRTGSTWLASMMGEIGGYEVWKEPMLGGLFGDLYYLRGSDSQRKSRHFVLGVHREAWLKSIRSFVLDGAAARFPGARYLVIKEPNGSIGAPLLSEALPESRLLLLVRDPRDVVASVLDSGREGAWRQQARIKKGKGGPEVDTSAEKWATLCFQHMGNAARAHESHPGPKALVRYEDLLTDTLGEMKRVYSELGLPAHGGELARAVEKYSWKNIPEKEKGEGKFYRKATPGSWREDLSEEQARVVEEITASLLEEFYPG